MGAEQRARSPYRRIVAALGLSALLAALFVGARCRGERRYASGIAVRDERSMSRQADSVATPVLPGAADAAREASPPAEALPGAIRTLESCLASWESPAAMQVCLDELGPVSAEALSIWLCETQLPRQGISAGLAHVLTRLSPDRFLEYADEIQAGCVRFQEAPFWMEVIDRARESAPAWAAGLAAQLQPGTVFGARSEAPVQIAESFVADDERVRRLLEDAARGYFGGSPEQRFRAGLIAVVNPRPGEGSTAFLGSLLDSPLTTADGQMGCLLAQFLAAGSVGSDRSESAALLLRTLQDERFSRQASQQLVETFDESGASGIDAAQWDVILRTARGIVGDGRGARDE